MWSGVVSVCDLSTPPSLLSFKARRRNPFPWKNLNLPRFYLPICHHVFSTTIAAFSRYLYVCPLKETGPAGYPNMRGYRRPTTNLDWPVQVLNDAYIDTGRLTSMLLKLFPAGDFKARVSNDHRVTGAYICLPL